MKKIEITIKQAEQFNRMRAALLRIAGIGNNGRYMTPAQIKRDAEKNHGLDYEEELEMVYENIQGEARVAGSGVRAIEIPVTESEIIHKAIGPHSL